MNSHAICKAAVIGAGVMGAGIAAVIANAGIPVCLLDIVPPMLTAEDEKSGLTLQSPAFRNKFALAGLGRISDAKCGALFTPKLSSMIQVGNLEDDLTFLEDCDWIVEVVLEDLQVKRDLLQKIAPHCKKTAIVSSNTSGVSITAIVAEMPPDFRSRFLGTHFFNPPRQMRLFELIPGEDTNPTILSFMSEFGKQRLGKCVVLAKDTPNFIGNRIGVYAFATVYTAAAEFGFTMEKADLLTGTLLGRPKSATFRTIDMVGIDVLQHVCDNLRQQLPNEETELLAFPPALDALYHNHFFGDKTGGGCYKTIRNTSGVQRLVWDGADYVPLQKPTVALLDETRDLPFAQRLWAVIDGGTNESMFVWRVLREILLYAARLVPEITDDYKAIDQAMECGYNWQFGPFALWDALGFAETVQRLANDGVTLPDWVTAKLASGQAFYTATDEPSKSTMLSTNAVSDLVDLGDGVLCLLMHTKGGAIGYELLESIDAAITELENRPGWKGLVLASTGKNFLNGADLRSFTAYIKAEEWGKVEALSDSFHRTSLRLKYAKKPVVAAVSGMALGGGLELVMHCPRVVAHCEAKLGLVEFNVGVLPAGGGCKELLSRYFSKLDGISGADYYPFLRKVWEQITTARVSKNAVEAMDLFYLRPTDRIVMDDTVLVAAAKNEVLYMFKAGFYQATSAPIRVLGITGYAYLDSIIANMQFGNFITPYDAHISREIATVLTGGEVPRDTMLTEDQLMTLEKRGITRLCQEEKTLARMEHMLQTGKSLHN